MSDISAVHTALFSGVPLLILWNIIALVIITSQKIYLKRAKKFCESENTIQTTGIVNNLITRTFGDSDSPNYYASYIFYTINNEPFTGEYGLEHQTDYQKGLSVTVYYDKNNPVKNICINEMNYKEKLIHVFYKMILFGTLAISGITFVVFLSRI